MTQPGASLNASLFAATCGTCAHRDSGGVCQEPRSAWHGWQVGAAHRDCYFYNHRPTLPYLGIGLADEPAEEQGNG